MSTEMQTKVQASPAQNFTPVQTGLLRRKSALCNTPGLVEDSGRDKEKLTLQHSSVDQVGTSTMPRFGHDFSRVSVHSTGQGMIQTKLKINKPGDIYEQEADRVADAVMQMPEPRVQRRVEPEEEEEGEPIQAKPLVGQITPLVQRQVEPEEEEEEEEEPIQAKETSGQTPHVSPIVQTQIHSLRGGGQRLSPSLCNFFEPRFGHDFSRVRVHTDAKAAESARAVNARAFTVGHDVVFGAGQYTPETPVGQRLLAHELTHVVQQNQHLGIQSSAHAAESEAGQAAIRVAMGQPALVHTTVKGVIQRQPISKKEVGRRTKAPAGVGASHIGEVLDVLKQPDPVASSEHHDFKEAFRILNALWMPNLLITLTELRQSDTGYDPGYGENYLELLISKTESFDVSDRLVTTMLVVMGSYLAGAIELKEHLSSSDRTDIADYLKRTQTGASEMHLRIIEEIEGLRVELTTQPQPSQWSNRVRRVQQLRGEEAIDAYVALFKDVPGVRSDEVRVAKSSKDYLPGYINFDPAYKGTGAVIPSKPPEKRDKLPEKPKLILGPSSIVESSPIYTQVTLKHERTHERHYYLLIECAKRWKSTSKDKYPAFGQWLLEVGRKTMSEGDYYLIMNMFEEPARDFRIKGITEMLSNLESFTAYYHIASEEKVKESLSRANLLGIACELDYLRPGKAKEHYKKVVYDRLRSYYRDKLGEGHRRTFDSALDHLAVKWGTEGQKRLYARWAEFRSEFR